MKKVMFLLAVAGMFSFASCNNTPAEEEIIDTPVVEAVEQVVDTNATEAVAEDAAAQEVVAQ